MLGVGMSFAKGEVMAMVECDTHPHQLRLERTAATRRSRLPSTAVQNGNCTPADVVSSSCGPPVDGPAASAVLGCVGTMTTDGSTLWFGDQHTVRALDIANLTVSTVAGDPALCAALDGTRSGALFHDIRGLTYWNGQVYLLDGCEAVLRRLDPTTGTVVTIGEMIRAYNTVTGWVGTLIGGTQGYADGTGAAVQLDCPRGMASDGTSVYWGEQLAGTLRQVVIQTAEASTLVGVRGCALQTDGVGADASRDWSGNCGAGALSGLPQSDTPLGGLGYHFPSRSLFAIDAGWLRRIE